MKFREYYQLINESYLSELPIIAQKYNVEEAEAFERKARDAGMDISKELTGFDHGIEHNAKLDYVGRTNLLKNLRAKVLQALVLIHETEYKLSQVKKFGGQVDVSAIQGALVRLCQYCKHYIMGVMSIRVAVDAAVMIDQENLAEVQHMIKTPTEQLWPEVIRYMEKQAVTSKQFQKHDGYDLIYLDMMKAKTLPQLLVAVSKGLNATHDSGPLLTYDDGDDNTLSYEPPFSLKDLNMLSNINHRKLDRELQQELAK